MAALLLCVPALAAETPRLKIEVPGQNVKPQEEFAVTLSLHDIPSIAALGFHISYDKTRLELTGYEDAGLTGWMVGIGQGEGAVWVNEKGWSGDGSCLKLACMCRGHRPNQPTRPAPARPIAASRAHPLLLPQSR